MRTFAFPPFAMKDQHGHWSGIDIDYTKVLLDESNCRYTFVELPWGQGMELLKLGKIDMMIKLTKMQQRAPYMHFVGPQRMENLLLVSKKGAFPLVSSWEEMKTLQVNLMRQRGSFIGH